jgi:hypothetical protein
MYLGPESSYTSVPLPFIIKIIYNNAHTRLYHKAVAY